MIRRQPRSLFRLLCCAGALLSSLALGANVAPVFTAPASNPALRQGDFPKAFDLKTWFNDPDVTGTAVRVSVRLASVTKTVDIALFDQQTPLTVANFLAYVNSGRAANNVFHRVVKNFVVQGGGFAWDSTGNIGPVTTYPAVANEPGISNVRGTVAMAKLGSDPNSATSQWFVSLVDNSANLDNQNGGFTVFGRVVGNGMAVMDEVALVPIYNVATFGDSFPLKDLPANATSFGRVHTVETSTAIISALSFTASSSDPDLLAVSVTGSSLKLTPSTARSGTAVVTLSATDLDGAVTGATVNVDVNPRLPGWHVEAGFENGQPAAAYFDPADTTPLSVDPVAVGWGEVHVGTNTSRTFSLRNDGPNDLTNFSVTLTGTNAADFQVTSGGGASTLASGQSRTFSVTYAPKAVGSRTASLKLAGDNASYPALDLVFTGTGLPDVVAPSVSSLAPKSLSVGITRTVQIPDWRSSVTATDDVAVTSFTQSPAPGSFQTVGTYSLVFSAADAAGNVGTSETTLTIGFNSALLPQVLAGKAHAGANVPLAGSAGLPFGAVLGSFGTPAISDDRDLACRVVINAGAARFAGIYFEDAAGQSKLMARQGQTAGVTNVPGALFKSFRDPVLAPGGAIAFAATLSGVGSTEDEGVWTDVFGQVQPILREGSPIPGLGTVKLKSVTSMALSDTALLALVKLVPTVGLVDSTNDTALVRMTSRTAGTLLARTGAPFNGSTIKQISVLQPATRSLGQGRWIGESDVLSKLTLADRRIVLARLHNDGSQILLLQARPSDLVIPSGLASLGLPSFGSPGIALAASKAFLSGVDASNDGRLLYSADGITFNEVVREEPGVSKFASFSDPVANDQGAMLFFGSKRAASGSLPPLTGLWRTVGVAEPELVAQVGGTAVDGLGQPIADTKWSVINSFALPSGAGAGPVFVASLTGSAVGATKKVGLWAVDSSGVLRLLLRTGDQATFTTTPLLVKKTVKSFTLLNSLPGSFGVARSYNTRGALATQVVFSDGSQAVLRLDVP